MKTIEDSFAPTGGAAKTGRGLRDTTDGRQVGMGVGREIVPLPHVGYLARPEPAKPPVPVSGFRFAVPPSNAPKKP